MTSFLAKLVRKLVTTTTYTTTTTTSTTYGTYTSGTGPKNSATPVDNLKLSTGIPSELSAPPAPAPPAKSR